MEDNCDGNVWFVSRNNVSDALYTLITTYSPHTSNGFLIIQFYICLHLSTFQDVISSQKNARGNNTIIMKGNIASLLSQLFTGAV